MVKWVFGVIFASMFGITSADAAPRHPTFRKVSGVYHRNVSVLHQVQPVVQRPVQQTVILKPVRRFWR